MDVDAALHRSQKGVNPYGATSRLMVYAVAPGTGVHVKVISSSLADVAVADAGADPGGALEEPPNTGVTGLNAVFP